MNAISIKDLYYSYDGTANVIDGLSLDIEKGKYTCLLGPNGCGKSTLARLCTGLLPFQKGTIEVLGLPLGTKTIAEIRKKVGIVFQNPDNQFISATVEDDIAFGLENRSVPTKDMPPIILDFAKRVGMENYLNKEPSNLSGGQKQRVAIAGVLALRPDIVIFDEATSMLDPKGRRDIRELIARMREENPELTMVSITHDVEEAYLADEVVVMESGKTVIKGSPEEAFKDRSALERSSLSVPFFLDLKSRLLAEGYHVEGAADLNGLAETICRSR